MTQRPHRSAESCGCDYGLKPEPHICEQHLAELEADRGWVGFDLDGTLSKTVTDIWSIGDPVPEMVAKVADTLAAGYEVRIITARVGCTGRRSLIDIDDEEWVRYQRALIEDWCISVFGVPLPITATKDFRMIACYDDRIKQVFPDTGILMQEELAKAQIARDLVLKHAEELQAQIDQSADRL